MESNNQKTRRQKTNPFKRLMAIRGMGQVITVGMGLVVLCIVFGLINENFSSAANVTNLLRQIAPILLIGIAQSFVLITGNIDLSIGSVVGMSTMIVSTLMSRGVMPPVGAIAVTLLCCLAIGVMNGFLVAQCKLPPFIATLGTMTIARGIAQIVNNNYNTDSIMKFFPEAAQRFKDFFYYGKTLGIYNGILIAVVLWVIFNFMLSKTRTGRHIYAVGSNMEAARLSGVSITLTTIKAYAISSFCACVVGFITCATVGQGTMDAGNSYELYAVAASVIGGVSTLGGQGILLGTVIGAAVWGVLQNGLQFAGAPVALRNIVVGVIVVLSVLIDVVVRKGRKKKKNVSAQTLDQHVTPFTS